MKVYYIESASGDFKATANQIEYAIELIKGLNSNQRFYIRFDDYVLQMQYLPKQQSYFIGGKL